MKDVILDRLPRGIRHYRAFAKDGITGRCGDGCGVDDVTKRALIGLTKFRLVLAVLIFVPSLSLTYWKSRIYWLVLLTGSLAILIPSSSNCRVGCDQATARNNVARLFDRATETRNCGIT